MIKPFSFTDFFESNWKTWKNNALRKALVESSRNSSKYAYGKNQSKIPILFDKEDWKFLSQFKPSLWSQALQWRYNEGLLTASEIRHQDPNHRNPDGSVNYDSIPDRGTVVLRGKGGNTFIYNDVKLGLKELMKKLEDPAIIKKELHPGGAKGDVGLNEIDPRDFNEKLPDGSSNPKWRGRYKNGLYDYDLTLPVRLPPEYFDELPEDLIRLPKGQEPTKENIAKQRERLKKVAQHSFAGMGVMQPDVAQKKIKTWIQSQALGLLGQPKFHFTPTHSKEIMGTDHDDNIVYAPKSPQELGRKKASMKTWPGHVGEEDAHEDVNFIGKKESLKIPYTNKTIKYQVMNKKGEVKDVAEEVDMPYLMPTKILPALAAEFALTPTQRYILAKRRNFKFDKYGITNFADWRRAELGAFGINDVEKAKTKQAVTEAGQPKSITHILQNWDLWTDEQKKHLNENGRDLVDLAVAQRTSVAKDKIDPWTAIDKQYPIGWSANKGKIKLNPLDLSDEQAEKVVDTYWSKMVEVATKQIDSFILYSAGIRLNSQQRKEIEEKGGINYDQLKPNANAKLPADVIKMLGKIAPNLIECAASFLCLNLNDPRMGIYNKELGLENVENTKEKAASATYHRNFWVWGFAHTLSQAAFGDVGSRRKRQKSIANVSMDQQSGSAEGGSLGDVMASADGGKAEKGIIQAGKSLKDLGPDWDERRNQFAPITEPTGTDYHVARMAWNVPEINERINKHLRTYRVIVQERLGKALKKKTGEDGNEMFDDLARKATMETAAIGELYKQGVQQAIRSGKSLEAAIVAGEEAVHTGISSKLSDQGEYSPEDVARMMKQHRELMSRHVELPESLTALQKDAADEFIEELNTEGESQDFSLQHDTEKSKWRIIYSKDEGGDEVMLSKEKLQKLSLDMLLGWWKEKWYLNDKGYLDSAVNFIQAVKGNVNPEEIQEEMRKLGHLKAPEVKQPKPTTEPQKPFSAPLGVPPPKSIPQNAGQKSVSQRFTPQNTGQKPASVAEYIGLPADWMVKLNSHEWINSNTGIVSIAYNKIKNICDKKLETPEGKNSITNEEKLLLSRLGFIFKHIITK